MAYSEAVLTRAKARLAQAREQRDQENQRRIAAIYRAHPRLREIDRQLRTTAAQIMRAAFTQGGDPALAVEEVRRHNQALQQEWDRILASEGIGVAELRAEPVCTACGGTGYVGAWMCECLRELCRQEQKKELSSLLGGRESFETFRLDYYSDAPDPHTGISPRTVMQKVLRKCRKYAEQFSASSPSLLFSGGTGLGKTFLSAAIARAAADRGFSAVYDMAGKVFSDFEAEKFGGAANLTVKYLKCDLMILDDLGTEMTTQFTLSALYSLVNSRLIAGLPTIISTNLTTQELQQRYTPQIASRLLGAYELVLFVGSDIRLRDK
ncbi:MAG: ATP-binding protein [Oscillospiraceae bacterium]|nr:ATP-binding protein [Oscillospiraceae bacterium]